MSVLSRDDYYLKPLTVENLYKSTGEAKYFQSCISRFSLPPLALFLIEKMSESHRFKPDK